MSRGDLLHNVFHVVSDVCSWVDVPTAGPFWDASMEPSTAAWREAMKRCTVGRSVPCVEKDAILGG